MGRLISESLRWPGPARRDLAPPAAGDRGRAAGNRSQTPVWAAARLHRGVYAVGHPASDDRGSVDGSGDRLGSPGSVESPRGGGTAGDQEPIRPRSDGADVASKAARDRDPLPAALPPGEVTIVKGIPVTTVARTLLDLAAVLTWSDVRRTVNAAEVRRPAGVDQLAGSGPAPPGRHGIRTARSAWRTSRQVSREASWNRRFRAFRADQPACQLRSSTSRCTPAAGGSMRLRLAGGTARGRARRSRVPRDRCRVRARRAPRSRAARGGLAGDTRELASALRTAEALAADLRSCSRVLRNRDRPSLPRPAALDDGAIDLEDSVAMARQAERDRDRLRDAAHPRPITTCSPELEGGSRPSTGSSSARGSRSGRARGPESPTKRSNEVADEKLRCVSLGETGRVAPGRAAAGPITGDLIETVDQLAERDFRCVIAHPERHAGADFRERLEALVERGALIQVTAKLIAEGPASPVLMSSPATASSTCRLRRALPPRAGAAGGCPTGSHGSARSTACGLTSTGSRATARARSSPARGLAALPELTRVGRPGRRSARRPLQALAQLDLLARAPRRRRASRCRARAGGSSSRPPPHRVAARPRAPALARAPPRARRPSSRRSPRPRPSSNTGGSSSRHGRPWSTRAPGPLPGSRSRLRRRARSPARRRPGTGLAGACPRRSARAAATRRPSR